MEYGALGKVEVKTVYDNNGWRSKKSKFINVFLVECEYIDSSNWFIEIFHPNGVHANKKWYCNNKLQQNFNYNKKGEKHGFYEDYSTKGYVKEEYKDGKKHGSSEGYYDNGKMVSKSEYRDGEEYGNSISYWKDG